MQNSLTDSSLSTHQSMDLKVQQSNLVAGVDEYDVREIRIYFLEDQKIIKVRKCNPGVEYDYDLYERNIGLRIDNGTLLIGEGVALTAPTQIPHRLRIYKQHTQSFFTHVIDPDTQLEGLTEVARDIEFVGAGDDRDECDLGLVGKPRNMYRFRLSAAAISLKIIEGSSGPELEVSYEKDLLDGLDHLITTNIVAIN